MALCVLMASASLHCALAETAPRGAASSGLTEPTVTRAESDLLAKAQGLASTNTLAAVELLTDETGPDASAALNFALGNFLFQENKLERAAQSYRTAIDKLPLFKTALGNLGRIYLLQEKPEQALALYRRLAENGLASADAYALLAQAHLMRENYVSAETAFRQTLLLKPDDKSARMGLAKCLLQQERFKECRALTGELLKSDPNNGELWSLRANIDLAMNATDKALVAIESARRLQAADADMLLTLGDIYLNRGQPKEAVAAYEAAFAKRAPKFERLVRMARALAELGEPRQAQTMLKRAEDAIDSNEGDSQRAAILKLRGDILVRIDQREAALRNYNQALKLDPLDATSLLALARIFWEQGEPDRAVLNCERAARISGHEADALVLQAQIEVDREHYARAVKLLERSQAFEQREYVGRYLEQVRRIAENP